MFSFRKKSSSPLSRAMRRLSARSTGAAVLSDGQRRAIRFGTVSALLVVCLLLLLPKKKVKNSIFILTNDVNHSEVLLGNIFYPISQNWSSTGWANRICTPTQYTF